MVALPQMPDPTLALADKALENAENGTPHRPYLGMSSIGGPCDRALWYGFRWASEKSFDAATLKRFADGHQTEAVAVARLKACGELEVHDLHPDTGRQFGFEDHHGHFRGHMDGVVLGLLQAPKTWHVLEIKAVSDAKFRELEKAKETVGEKLALRHWNETYYGQAVLYMDYADLDRHYCVVCTPGGRRWTSVRTERDKDEAARLRGRAQNIIASESPPARISDSPAWYQCRWCDHAAICHEGQQPLNNCRTCLHSTPIEAGEWHCARWEKKIDTAEQREGCPAHLYIPGLIAGEQVDAGPDWVEYRMPDGSIWRDGGSAYTIGDTVERDGCRYCGVVTFLVEEGKGPHAAGLRCTGCGRHGGWLSKAEAYRHAA